MNIKTAGMTNDLLLLNCIEGIIVASLAHAASLFSTVEMPQRTAVPVQ